MRPIEAFAALFLVWVLCAAFFPFSYFYHIGQMEIRDVVAGEDIVLEYSGGAKREFSGSYQVILRRVENREVACDATSGRFHYDPDAVRPHPLTMGWWAPQDLRCQMPRPGEYVLETCWEVHDVLWLPISVKDCVNSNIFRVHPPH